VQGFNRRKATRRNFPADLPRRRVLHPAPTTCRAVVAAISPRSARSPRPRRPRGAGRKLAAFVLTRVLPATGAGCLS
jgi:hypothetical protein